MSMKQIRDKYNVPAKRGMIVGVGNDMKGVIVGSYGLYLRIRVYGDVGISTYHPTWQITYNIEGTI